MPYVTQKVISTIVQPKVFMVTAGRCIRGYLFIVHMLAEICLICLRVLCAIVSTEVMLEVTNYETSLIVFKLIYNYYIMYIFIVLAAFCCCVFLCELVCWTSVRRQLTVGDHLPGCNDPSLDVY